MRKACDGLSARRHVLRLGALTLGGLGLNHLLAAADQQRSVDTSVILFWMWGGPRQLETYDLKPEALSTFGFAGVDFTL